ncbi:MAG: CDP-diacylglycerol--serine O-phosphatidyltransferase [Rikenellaceae bacterium]|nr:CDP-diacylglycerol--serine O-phosphatidyltransferase [Rikenellaceae bacterium]
MKVRMFTLPNMLTLGNLLCGCTALPYCLGQGNLKAAFWLVAAAAVFDFLDGLAARLTESYSELGKQLDSLADMVSFGAVPSAVLYTMYVGSGGDRLGIAYGIVTACVALFSALRLAKFNIDQTQAASFRGLPTPACALLVAASGWIFTGGALHVHPVTILAGSILLSCLLICPLEMFALKFSDRSWNNNRVRYTFLILSAASVAVWRIWAIPFIVLGYILLSVASAFVCSRSAETAGKPNG